MIVLEVTKEVIYKALEQCATYFDIENNEIKISNKFLEPKIEHYNYDFFEGINYEFDITKPIGSRVTKVLYLDQPLDEHKKYTLVLNNYRATGTGGFEFYTQCPIIKEYACDFQEVAIDALIKQKYIELKTTNSYRLIK